MVSPEMNPTICSVFEAEIVLLFHATTFRRGFQVTVHVGNVRQTAVVEKIHAKVRGTQPGPISTGSHFFREVCILTPSEEGSLTPDLAESPWSHNGSKGSFLWGGEQPTWGPHRWSPGWQRMMGWEAPAWAVTTFLLKDKLRTGEKAVVRFRFLKHPEYLKVGAKLLFREGVTKGIGHVTDVQAITAGEAQATMGF
jgi:hypothetical protein